MMQRAALVASLVAAVVAHDGCYTKYGTSKALCGEDAEKCEWVQWGAEEATEGKCVERGWRRKMHHHGKGNDELHRAHGGGSPVLCPFLKSVVPKAQCWSKQAQRFAAAASSQDPRHVAKAFTKDAVITWHSAEAVHNHSSKEKSGSVKRIEGFEAIQEHFANVFNHTLQLRIRGVYPDFVRKTGILTMQVFSRCPKSQQLFSSEWAFAINALEGKKIKSVAAYLQPWQAFGSQVQAASTAVADLASSLGQGIGQRNCAKMVETMADGAVVDIADAFFQHSEEDMFEMQKAVTSLKGRQEISEHCNQVFKHHSKIMPVEFLEVGQSYTAPGSKQLILTGAMTTKVIFSPKVTDFPGAIYVNRSHGGLIESMTVYPIEASALAEKWAWKYGHGCIFSRVQRLTTFAFRAGHRHPFFAAGAAIGILVGLFAGLACCFSRLGVCKRCSRKRPVSARELSAPLQDIA